MKTVILVRHGKAGWSHPEQDDMDRPLLPRGEKESMQMAEVFSDLDIEVHMLLSSPALRAQSTAKRFADQLALPVETDERLYDGTDSELLDVIQETDEEFSSILLVGHNPGLSDLLRDLLDAGSENLSSASVAVLDFDVAEWEDIHSGGGTLVYLLSPRALDRPHAA
jgi:phosphohistidine phosphatase